MAIKATVSSVPKSRVSLNTTQRETIRSVGILPTAGLSLSALGDVDASDADNNETLVYDQTTGKYVVKTLPNVDGGTF